MKKILLVLTLTICLLALAGCGGDKETTVVKDKPEPDNGALPAAGSTFTVCDVDTYSSCTSSEYLSFVLYNPNTDVPVLVRDNDSQPDTIAVTIPIGKNDLWNGDFLYAYDVEGAEFTGGYFHAIGGEDWVVPRFETSVQFYSLYSPENSVGLYTPTGEEQTLPPLEQPLREVRVVDSPTIICPDLMDESLAFSAHPGEFVTGDGWGYFIPEGETPTTVSSLYLPLREGTDGATCYAKVFLKEEIPYDSAALTAAAAKGDFVDLCAYRTVPDMDKLDEATNTIGASPKLSQTMFYQDLIATYLSRSYGLNLRDKNLFAAADRDSVVYRERNEYGLVQMTFEAFISDQPEAIKEAATSDYFSYTDKDGTQYSYFFEERELDSGWYVYVFRDDEVCCRILVTSRYDVPAKQLLIDAFGIRA